MKDRDIKNYMTHIIFLIGQTVEARNGLLEEEVRLKNIDLMNCLHIVPSRGMVMELEGQGPGSMNRQIDTLSSLIGRIFYDDIFYQSFRDSSFMDDAMRELAAHLSLERRNATPEGLQYFFPLFSSSTRTETLAGVYRHILGFFSLLVNNHFEDQFVEALSRRIIQSDEQRPGAGEERYALDTDLALLFGDYEEFKRSNHLYDNDDIISSVRSLLAEGNPPSILKDIDVLIFNGFTSITRSEETILLHLFNNVHEVIWPLDYDPCLEDPITAFIGATGHVRDAGIGRYEALRIFSSLGSLLKKMEDARYPTTIKRALPEEFKNPFASGLYQSGRYDDRGERAIQRDISALNTLKDLAIRTARELERAELFMPSRGTTPLLERFRRGFADLVIRSRIRESYDRGAVDISEWADIAGCSFDDIFAGGLCSDEFPLKEPDDFIIPESSAPYLRRTDLTDQSPYLFTHLLRNYRQDLCLSYPRRIADKEAQPSPVLLDMVSMMEIQELSPSQGDEALARSFPWEQNPYFTSSEELLNSIEVE